MSCRGQKAETADCCTWNKRVPHGRGQGQYFRPSIHRSLSGAVLIPPLGLQPLSLSWRAAP